MIPCGALDAIHDYTDARERTIEGCFHEEHDDMEIITINQRGNFCGDLPSLALTCREAFREVWGLIFPKNNDEITIHIKIGDLDFFPFLRFAKLLKRNVGMDITGNMIENVEFSESSPETGEEKTTYKRKFTRIKRLIEMHWHDGVPLWDCLTGLRELEVDDDMFGEGLEYMGYEPSVQRLT